MTSLVEAISRNAPSFTGQLLLSTDAEYDRYRRVHNGLIDKHPAAIARCRGVADVVDAVTPARTLRLSVAVRGGRSQRAGTRHDRRRAADRPFPHYLEGDAIGPAAVAYGSNLRRLRAIKARWDPDNFFRQHVNILPQ